MKFEVIAEMMLSEHRQHHIFALPLRSDSLPRKSQELAGGNCRPHVKVYCLGLHTLYLTLRLSQCRERLSGLSVRVILSYTGIVEDHGFAFGIGVFRPVGQSAAVRIAGLHEP
jgi:hypothetical protein